ncbi:unnamed protein product, partial [Mesorhabditis belari]|uniref:Phosphoglycolate phosphatase n=1 Tax=Mesorhabditis belari TaxID=2138241 RepID=A0AAF3EZH4_9BILA
MQLKLLTAEDLNRFETFLFDADGVLWRGGETIAGSVEFVQQLQRQGKRVFVITNNSTKTRSQYLKKLHGLGFDLPDSNVISPGVVLPMYLKDNGYENKKIYLIGTPSLKDSLEKGAGVKCVGLGPEHFEDLTDTDFIFQLENDEEIAAVVVSFDGHISYPKIMRAANYLRDSSVDFFITNEDTTFPGPCDDVIVPGTGCIAAAIRSVVDREPLVFGKPNTPIADFLKRHHHIDATKTIMFGDRLDTDIMFANGNGFTSCLMLTGIHSLETVNKAKLTGNHLQIPHFQFSFSPYAGLTNGF